MKIVLNKERIDIHFLKKSKKMVLSFIWAEKLGISAKERMRDNGHDLWFRPSFFQCYLRLKRITVTIKALVQCAVLVAMDIF